MRPLRPLMHEDSTQLSNLTQSWLWVRGAHTEVTPTALAHLLTTPSQTHHSRALGT